ncbi:MAG TPA: ACT domain-containing protein [Verrucomicrobia bacterium]|nr:ACT domain-containing protein [Verrucomicrobiota bacterium]HOP97221.1 ACT domain-containing protein [Verrucomicrobiota bacterium]HPU57805.1 ACT domain-containing protein [Verrucomicrobiota bacterium]
MRWKQLSVFLENKPGALSEPCRLLAGAQINIRTFSLADTREFGILRMVVDDPDKARRLLRRHGFAVRVNDVLVIEVPDRPGELAAILDGLDGSGINVKYGYGFTVDGQGKGVLVFAFDDPDKALSILKKKRVAAGLKGGR